MNLFGWSYLLLWLLVLALTLGVVTLFYYQGLAVITTKSRSQDHGPGVGATAPEMSVEALDGTTLRLGGALSDTPKVLFVSGTCRPCQLALKTIGRLGTRESMTDVAIVYRGPSAAAKKTIAENNLTASRVISDERGMIMRSWDVVSVPFVVVTDSKGRVFDKGNPSSADTLRRLLAQADGPNGTTEAIQPVLHGHT